jgi:hypothetical protein
MIHDNESPLSEELVVLRAGSLPDGVGGFRIEDWWDRIQGERWSESTHRLAIDYTARIQGLSDIPRDDNVLYGRFDDGEEALIHVIEVDEPI